MEMVPCHNNTQASEVLVAVAIYTQDMGKKKNFVCFGNNKNAKQEQEQPEQAL